MRREFTTDVTGGATRAPLRLLLGSTTSSGAGLCLVGLLFIGRVRRPEACTLFEASSGISGARGNGEPVRLANAEASRGLPSRCRSRGCGPPQTGHRNSCTTGDGRPAGRLRCCERRGCGGPWLSHRSSVVSRRSNSPQGVEKFPASLQRATRGVLAAATAAVTLPVGCDCPVGFAVRGTRTSVKPRRRATPERPVRGRHQIEVGSGEPQCPNRNLDAAMALAWYPDRASQTHEQGLLELIGLSAFRRPLLLLSLFGCVAPFLLSVVVQLLPQRGWWKRNGLRPA